MPRRFGLLHPQPPTPRGRRRSPRRLLAVARILGLVALFLLPMQMRAGADDPHPHALLQLILDARDGAIDHHADDGQDEDHEGHAEARGSHAPDVPAFGDARVTGGSMALLSALVPLFAVPAADSRGIWPAPSGRTGWTPAPEPPPPRSDRL